MYALRRLGAFLAACICALSATAQRDAHAADDHSRWEPRIAAFEEADRQNPPPRGAILFVGSSSIVGWDLPKCFPDLQVINRGFGGSQIADSTHFAERIILPYEPQTIVLYAGDNDIAAGKRPERVWAEFKAFLAKVHGALPEARIIFIAIKPSIARWKLVEKMRRANRMIAMYCDTDERLEFVDIDAPMIGPDGKPRAELFKDDGLHLNPDGYRLWTSLVGPHIE